MVCMLEQRMAMQSVFLYCFPQSFKSNAGIVHSISFPIHYSQILSSLWYDSSWKSFNKYAWLHSCPEFGWTFLSISVKVKSLPSCCFVTFRVIGNYRLDCWVAMKGISASVTMLFILWRNVMQNLSTKICRSSKNHNKVWGLLMPCSLAGRCQHFGETCCFHLQIRSSFILKMEAAGSSKQWYLSARLHSATS
jgi:hypothetical protein